VVSVINSPPLDLQVEPLVVVINHSNRLLRHLGKRGLPSAVSQAISFILHVRPLEQTEQIGG
jgi:hypothetical protein